MRAIACLTYLIVMIYFLIKGLYAAFIPMLLFALAFIGYLPVHKERSIKATKKKIIETQKAKHDGQTVKPFIEINSSPWYILSELPGVSPQMARHAVELRRQNGPYPSIDVFFQVTGVKHVYVEHIKTVAYVKHEIPPVNRNPKPEQPQEQPKHEEEHEERKED